MQRSRWLRLITSVWALWFAAILAQPAPLMAFLMRATMRAQAVAGVAPDASDPPAMPNMAGMPATTPHHPAPVDLSCAHLGACCCAPVLTAPRDVVPDIPAAPVRVVQASIPSNVAFAPAAAPAHARPFAIGPPAALG